MNPREANATDGAVGPTAVVIASGLATSALTLFGVYRLSSGPHDFNAMGWYLNYVLPAGAVLVGIAAASGYGLASWLTGVKISRRLLWTVMVLQVVAYFGAQYVEFAALDLHDEDGRRVGFLEYFDWAARSFAWTQKDGSAGEPLGAWGYCFRLLEIAGFAAGGLIIPAALRSQAYCEACQVYMRTRDVGLLPAGVMPKKLKKKDTQGLAAQQKAREEAWAQGTQLLEAVARGAAAGDAGSVRATLQPHLARKKEHGRLDRRIALSLSFCPRCENGFVRASLISGQGQQIASEKLGEYPVGPGFVKDLLAGSRPIG